MVSSDDANVKALPVPHSQLSVIAGGKPVGMSFSG